MRDHLTSLSFESTVVDAMDTSGGDLSMRGKCKTVSEYGGHGGAAAM